MWHPHLKRKWLDDKNYVIYDNRSKVYPTSLIQLKTGSEFLSNNKEGSNNSAKMQCGCRFLKQDIVTASTQNNIGKQTSFLETNSSIKMREPELGNLFYD